jgi:TonB-linked SusC/RagA family outer membrane protein
MRNRFFLSFMVVLVSIFIFPSSILAQQAATASSTLLVRGKVIDKVDKLAIIGASVVELDKDKRTVTGVVTDLDGNFAIKIKDASHTISISYLGYKSQVVAINGRTTINISLESNYNELAGVTVTATKTGTSGLMAIADRDLTTANVSISARELQEMQSTSIDEALQGRIAGVDIASNSGDPGSGMSIRIRGTSSISGSAEPLIVVDGLPYETTVPSDFNFGTADQDGYAQLLNIAPADIETITILKDAAATAVWGARASNGVLLITTKRGTVGTPTINYAFRGSLSTVPKGIPLLTGDQYSQLIPELFMNRNGTPLNTLVNKEFQYDPSDVYWFKNYSNNTDWIDAITQTGLSGDHTVSLQGGGEKAKYYTSVGYLDQKGVTKGTGLNRISARLNLDYTVSSRIRFRTDFSYTHSVTDRNYVNAFNANDGDRLRSVANNKLPNMSIYEYDEYGNLTPNYFSPAQNIQGAYSRTYNPAAMAEFATNQQTGERITPIFNLKYDIIPSILYSDFSVMFDINNSKVNNFLPQNATGRPYTETVVNRAGDSDLDQFRVQSKANFIFNPKIGDNHEWQSILSLQSDDYRGVSQESLTSNTASSLLTDPSNPSRTQNTDLRLLTGIGESRSVGALISTQYKYADKYIINVGLRADGSSKFGPNNRYGYFPSISTRWRVSSEKFMKKLKFIDDLSVRASYGQSGRAPRADYLFYNFYGNFQSNYLGLSGVFPSNIELKNLKWETVSGTNLGFNLEMLNRKLKIDVDLYKNRSTDLLFENLQISGVSGFNDLDLNFGKLDNQGWEVGINATPYKSKDLTIDFGFNIASNVNVIREISEFFPSEDGFSDRNGSYKRFLQINNPYGSFYGYKFKGVYTDQNATIAKDANGNQIVSPSGQPIYMRFNYPKTDYVFQQGDAMYEDINFDGNIDSRDVVYLGNSNPKFTGGFGPSFNYKNRIRLSTFFSYRIGYEVINQTDMFTTNLSGFDNQSTAVLSRWRNPGDVTNIPRSLFASGYNWLGSDRYVEDASFVRFRTATISYSLGPDMLKKIKVADVRVFITGENMFTLTNYRGQDPEINMQRGVFGVALDNSRTPPTKRFTFGLSTRF